MSIKVLDEYKGKLYDSRVKVVGLSEVLGVRYVAFQQASNGNVFWHSEEIFLRDYKPVRKYRRGDLLEFDNKGQKVRVLYLNDQRVIRITPWDSTDAPSEGRIEYYLTDIGEDPKVLRNFDSFIANAYEENNS